MKFNILTLLLVILTPAICQAQTVERSTTNLLPHETFDTMIIQDITYAVTGENIPATGIKVDLAKPEATIAGFFPSKKAPQNIFGFELKGGITDHNFSLLKGFNNFNTAFEFRPVYHRMSKKNSAFFLTDQKPIILAKNTLAAAECERLLDTFQIATIFYQRHLRQITQLGIRELVPPDFTPAEKDIFLYFLKKFKIKNEGYHFPDSVDLVTEMVDIIPEATPATGDEIQISTYNDEIVETFRKYARLEGGRQSVRKMRQIANTSEAWTKKNYLWWSLSPVLRTEKITEYHTRFEGKDSNFFKPNFTFYYGASVYLNWFCLYPKRKLAYYAKAGLTASHGNNLSTFNSFNYETRNLLFTDGKSNTDKTKSGSAYNFSEIKYDFVGSVFGEFYLLPLNSFVPGGFITMNMNISDLYRLPKIMGRTNDRVQLALDAGLVFNLASKEKQRSVLSLSPYFRCEDLTDSRRTSLETGLQEKKEDFVKRNISFGLRVGIPIYLPQRSE